MATNSGSRSTFSRTVSRRRFLRQASQASAILAAATSLGGVPLLADDQPKPDWEMTKTVSLEGLEISLSKPRLVARSHGYLWFPTMTRALGGELFANFSTNLDAVVADRTSSVSWSADDGLTWSEPSSIMPKGDLYGRTFREAFIRPGLDPERWGNRSNYAALNIVPTSPTEMSICTSPFRRFTLRTDGFASVHVGADVGELVTHPLRFTGKELVINYSTSAGGSVRVEIQDESGQPIPGFSLGDSRNLVGDAIEQQVNWTKGSDVLSLAGQTVRLGIVMQEADLFAIQFRE